MINVLGACMDLLMGDTPSIAPLELRAASLSFYNCINIGYFGSYECHTLHHRLRGASTY